MVSRVMPSHNGPSQKSSTTSEAPNQTLYCTNLPDKLQKRDLRLALYTLFSTYGPVLDVVALKTSKMRGQAHIVFRDVQASTQAMRALQGFDFFGKEMKMQYAKGKSDTIAKLDGTYRMPVIPTHVVTSTELQQSIFNALPSSSVAAVSTAASTTKESEISLNGPKADADEPQGLKRRREDESDEEGAPMEEDDSEPMEASSDDD